MSVDDFAVFAKGTICSQFIDSVPMLEIARAASQVEMKLSVLLERRSEWEASFVAKYGIEWGEVGLVKMIASYCVMAQCDLDVASLGFVKVEVPPQQPQTVSPELLELKQLVQGQALVMEGLRKQLEAVSAKAEAESKRKMAKVPPLCKAEIVKVRELDSKPQWVFASLLALSTLLWRREVPQHEYVSKYKDKEKFTDAILDELAPVVDADSADTEVWQLESMDDDELTRLRSFVQAVWTFTVTSLSAYRGKKGLDPGPVGEGSDAAEDASDVPVLSAGCTGAAEEEVVGRRLQAMKGKFRVEGGRRLYTAKPGAEPMDVTNAPVTACRACKNAGRGVKRHWFHECPGFD